MKYTVSGKLTINGSKGSVNLSPGDTIIATGKFALMLVNMNKVIDYYRIDNNKAERENVTDKITI